MAKKKEFNPKVQWAKFIVVLILYLLFLYWVKSWWGLLVVPFIYHQENQMAMVEGG